MNNIKENIVNYLRNVKYTYSRNKNVYENISQYYSSDENISMKVQWEIEIISST